MRHTLLFRKSLLLSSLFFISAIGFSQVNEDWVKRQNGDANSADQANDLVVDCNGNVIVTGTSVGNGTADDYATIKYNDDGDTKWIKRYNGPGNRADQARAITADNKARVYVTGWSTGSGTGADFATIKYDDDGDTKWVRRFNGPGNGNDQAVAIAVDEKGNVYVTGWSTGNGTGTDFTTIKYDDDGDTKWVRSYNGAGNGSDQATAISVDKYGNVYVTGFSTGIGTGSDITTIKYDANGNQQWVSTYNGPVNATDRANALAVDELGNVYVTGMITIAVDEEDDISFTDIATIKYNAAGVQQWAATYNRREHDEANAIALDRAGNVYLTGVSGGVDEDPVNDYVTIKYNTTGVQQWATLFISPGFDQNGEANDLVLDTAGNVFITGGIANVNALDYGTIKYNTNGVQQWVAFYDGPGNTDVARAIGLDKDGNVYVTGLSRSGQFGQFGQFDYATVKYDPAGVQQWVERYDGHAGQRDFANALAVNSHGHVHVTGGIDRLNTGLDYTTFKYDDNGDRIWKKTYNGPGNGTDIANAMALDANDNVYVTGQSTGNGSLSDYATIKYSEDGETRWVKRYNGPANGGDVASAIAMDGNGNVYVTGASAGNGSSSDYATIKYDKNGNTKWVKRYNGPGNFNDQANAIAVDNQGNVYVTGQSDGSGTLQDYATIKYDANGNELWVARFNGAFNRVDEAVALVVDASGNVYVTGGSQGDGFVSDYATIKYNAAGVQQWVAFYNGPLPFSSDLANAIGLDAAGNVYVTGESGGVDYATVKYNAAGVQQWDARYNNGNFFSASANALALDAQGNVYVTGVSAADYATVKYNTAGVQQWDIRYDGPINSLDIATAIGLDDEGNVFVTGRSFGNGTEFDYATIKYEQTPVMARVATNPDQNDQVVADQGLAKLTAKAFPNAFTEYINLQWSGNDKPVTITITDVLGRLVEKRTGLASSGNIRIGNQFKAGVYFATIVQGGEKVLVKLIKK